MGRRVIKTLHLGQDATQALKQGAVEFALLWEKGTPAKVIKSVEGSQADGSTSQQLWEVHLKAVYPSLAVLADRLLSQYATVGSVEHSWCQVRVGW